MEAIKESRTRLKASFDSPEWADRKQYVDGKIAVLEGLLQRLKCQYDGSLKEKRVKAQQHKSIMDELDRPFDFSALEEAIAKYEQASSALLSTAVETAEIEPISEPGKILNAATADREELLRRRRPLPSSPSQQQQSRAMRRAYEDEHDSLSADLLLLARNLKKNNLAFQSKLKQDASVIKETELVLNSVEGKFKKEHENLKTFRRASWSSMGKTLLLMFLLFAGFIGLYLFIKVTSK